MSNEERQKQELRVSRRQLLTTGTAVAGAAVVATSPIGRSFGLNGVAGVAAQDATPATSAAVLGGEIKMAYAPPATLNPLFSTAGTDQGVERQIYGALVMMTADKDPQLDLAETVDISEDAMTYTFTLKEGLVFTDGTPLTSKDVLFTFHRAIDPATGSVWRSRLLPLVGADTYDGTTVTEIEGLTAPDDRTIVMKLNNPDATWMITLGDFAGFCILPEHAFGTIAPDQLQEAPFTFNPTPSAGAFTFEEYQADQYVAIKRNDSYDPPKANIDRLFLTILPQSVTALSQLQNGEIDILQVAIPDMETVEQNPNLTLATAPSLMLQWMIPNATRPAFADKRVRQAMIYALDRASMAKEIMKDQVTVINSPFFGWQWEEGEPAGLNPYDFDPDKARSLLAEANWDSSTSITSHFIPGNPVDETLLNIIQQQYKDVGINFELVAVDVPDYTNRLISGAKDGNTGDFDLILGSGGTMGQDPNVLTRYISTASATPAGANYTHFSNARVDELLVAGRATTDIAERKKIYTEIAQIINDEAIWIFLWRLNSVYGVNKRVQGFRAPGHPGRVISSAHEWWVQQ